MSFLTKYSFLPHLLTSDPSILFQPLPFLPPLSPTGMPYLDVIHRLRGASALPIAAYHVSGEYAMMKAAAQKVLQLR